MVKIVDRVDGNDPRTADMTGYHRPGYLEQICPGIGDGVHPIHLREDAVGFLNDIVGFQSAQWPTRKPAAQSRLMRQDIAQQPARSFPVRSAHPSSATVYYDEVSIPGVARGKM